MEGQNKTLSLSILSGKGGVGKTSLALNLAYALYAANQDTLLVDCDLGLANLDVMLGISPDKNLHDILNQDSRAEESVCRLEKKGLDLIPSASGVPEILELDEDQQILVIEKLVDFLRPYNFLLMDLGAGISRTVQSFAQMTHHRVVVITPDPTSLTDAYALIKVLNTRHGICDYHVLASMVQSENEAVAGYERIRAACEKFLHVPLQYLGYVRHDSAVSESVRRQKPLVRHTPKAPAAQDIMRVADRLVDIRGRELDRLKKMPALTIPGSLRDS